VTDASGPEAGWYADPTSPGRMRRWDGQRWTDQVRDAVPPVPPVPPVPSVADVADPTPVVGATPPVTTAPVGARAVAQDAAPTPSSIAAVPRRSRWIVPAALGLAVVAGLLGWFLGTSALEPTAAPTVPAAGTSDRPPSIDVVNPPASADQRGGEDLDTEPATGGIFELAPGVEARMTAGVWQSQPARWLQGTSACVDLPAFVATDIIAPGPFTWVYWRSDEAMPSDQVAVADTFGEYGWGVLDDEPLVDPGRISVATEWIDVIRYDRWPTGGSSSERGELAYQPATGYAIVARTVSPAGFLGVGSVIVDAVARDMVHDPRQLIESLTFDLDRLIASCD